MQETSSIPERVPGNQRQTSSVSRLLPHSLLSDAKCLLPAYLCACRQPAVMAATFPSQLTVLTITLTPDPGGGKR